jgi:ribosomal protein S18 acetylase RimI-like enzyme
MSRRRSSQRSCNGNPQLPAIRRATPSDARAIWSILQRVIAAGETYALPRDWSREQTLAYWFDGTHEVFVAEQNGIPVGTYYLRANQLGGGSHVANCGYVTAPAARGRGIARRMCLHSLEEARHRGFCAMQFNFVVSSNRAAVSLWESLSFEIVGTIPKAFDHPCLGLVDALVMHRPL